MNRYNVWNKWGRLKTVVLGDRYSSSFFQDIKNNRIRSALQQISDETHEDLQNFEKILKDFGCNVLRPELDPNDSIMNYIDKNGAVRGSQGVPKAPLQPRDGQFIVGNKLFLTETEPQTEKLIKNYNKEDIVEIGYLESIDEHSQDRHWTIDRWNELAGDDWGSYDDYKNNPDYFLSLPASVKDEVLEFHRFTSNNITAPQFTVVGRDIYVDLVDGNLRETQLNKLKKHFPNLRVNNLNIGGHNDACFHTLKPGVLLSLNEIQTYENTFPGWDVCYLPNQSWKKIEGFMKIKEQVGGKWWVPGQEDNDEFTNFVETWLQNWVGYVEETVFDVNVLVLDEHHVCVNNMNPTVVDFLKKHNMEPVYVPWRHRYFWDGGLHCITSDLEREGDQEDYFPERGEVGVIDHGFD